MSFRNKKRFHDRRYYPRIGCKAPWRLTKVKPQQDFILEVEFVDGTYGIVDMTQLITGSHAGVYARLKDRQLFNKATLHLGTVTWPGELDLAPDVCIQKLKNMALGFRGNPYESFNF